MSRSTIMTAIATVNKELILSKLTEGYSVTQIAAELGVTSQAISKNLADDPEYQAAREAFHETRLDKGEQMLEQAADMFQLKKAADINRSYQWRAEADLPSRYSRTRADSTHVITPVFIIETSGSAPNYTIIEQAVGGG